MTEQIENATEFAVPGYQAIVKGKKPEANGMCEIALDNGISVFTMRVVPEVGRKVYVGDRVEFNEYGLPESLPPLRADLLVDGEPKPEPVVSGRIESIDRANYDRPLVGLRDAMGTVYECRIQAAQISRWRIGDTITIKSDWTTEAYEPSRLAFEDSDCTPKPEPKARGEIVGTEWRPRTARHPIRSCTFRLPDMQGTVRPFKVSHNEAQKWKLGDSITILSDGTTEAYEPPRPKFENTDRYLPVKAGTEIKAGDMVKVGPDGQAKGVAIPWGEAASPIEDIKKYQDYVMKSLMLPASIMGPPAHSQCRCTTEPVPEEEPKPEGCRYLEPVPVKIDGKLVRAYITRGAAPNVNTDNCCTQGIGRAFEQVTIERDRLTQKAMDDQRQRVARLAKWPQCTCSLRNVDLVWIGDVAHWQCLECAPKPVDAIFEETPHAPAPNRLVEKVDGGVTYHTVEATGVSSGIKEAIDRCVQDRQRSDLVNAMLNGMSGDGSYSLGVEYAEAIRKGMQTRQYLNDEYYAYDKKAVKEGMQARKVACGSKLYSDTLTWKHT